MIRTRVVESLRDLAIHVGSAADGSEWHLFGSVDREKISASDIDLMILCTDAFQADTLRKAIDQDAFPLPLHLSLLTYAEAIEVDAVRVQHASRIYP